MENKQRTLNRIKTTSFVSGSAASATNVYTTLSREKKEGDNGSGQGRKKDEPAKWKACGHLAGRNNIHFG